MTTKKSFAVAGTALVAGAALALASALPASAHVGVTANTTAAGSYALLSFNLPHGCDGSPTTTLDISLPEEIIAATPTVVAGWDVEKVMAPIAATTDAHGNEVSERVAHVVYTSTTGGLPEGYRAQFDLQLLLPELDAGTVLGFPVLQTCAVGETLWDGEELPSITLTAATSDEHEHSDSSSDDGHDDEAMTDEETATDSGDDVLARALGIGGLVVGAVGIVLAVTARRKTSA